MMRRVIKWNVNPNIMMDIETGCLINQYEDSHGIRFNIIPCDARLRKSVSVMNNGERYNSVHQIAAHIMCNAMDIQWDDMIDYDVHHINGCHYDNHFSNLVILPISAHRRYHLRGASIAEYVEAARNNANLVKITPNKFEWVEVSKKAAKILASFEA